MPLASVQVSLAQLLVACGALLIQACMHAPVRPIERVEPHRLPSSHGRPPQEGEPLPLPVLPWSEPPRPFPLEWRRGEMLLHGFIGARYLSDFKVNPSGSPPIELDDDGYEVMPTIGGGAQWKLAGRAIDFGLEGLLSFSGRSELEAFAFGGGGAAVAFDINLLLFEAYGGPFASVFLGDGVRLYGGAGPLLQWVGYEQDSGAENEDADGSGGGVYARAGIEFLLPSLRLVGLGARWSESDIDLGDLGDLDLGGVELFFSYSYGRPAPSPFPGF